ncbi:DNA/RNA non-specific endonuclease [Arthrobacter sp. OV608]|uniref:DNA/RNA non-specific endonuclease n=1 Tax=Arthrobacter sp. OV608 TaxID=1882768 RepID=UPI0008C76C8C|nr:DNA/RNA non-specific endonuclease [Arthrobacter sp. OV608]SEQ59629.1 endonuclease G [Arthrobacter sp. OV608]
MTHEAQVATARDVAGRAGYDAGFLCVPVPIPELPGVETVLLPYTHFSVLMRPDKRLAAVTALAMDGQKLMELDRAGIRWRLDPRLPEDQQTGERVYARNDLDRGHLVRRASAVWGDTRAEAAQANEDTFYYTNAAPQVAKFNQGMELWLGLESYLQENAADNSRRIAVFTGPVFGATDPVYRGVDIPLRFFKVAAFLHHGELAATGYVVDQTPSLADLPDVPRPGVTDEAPPLGPFRTFQVPIRDIAALTGLDLDQLMAVDRMPIAAALPSARVTETWREVHSPEDLDLDFDLGE